MGVLCCFALFVCSTLLASFFLPSHLSFKNRYMHRHEVKLNDSHIKPTAVTTITASVIVYPQTNAFPHRPSTATFLTERTNRLNTQVMCECV